MEMGEGWWEAGPGGNEPVNPFVVDIAFPLLTPTATPTTSSTRGLQFRAAQPSRASVEGPSAPSLLLLQRNLTPRISSPPPTAPLTLGDKAHKVVNTRSVGSGGHPPQRPQPPGRPLPPWATAGSGVL